MEKELRQSIEKSGNNLHFEVSNFLDQNGWQVELSPYYCDDITKKPREVDIIANKAFSIFKYESPTIKALNNFKFYLFLECKYFNSPFAVRVINNGNRDNILSAFHVKGINKEELFSKVRIEEIHHYFTENAIGKLYDVPLMRETEKINTGLDSLIFDAITGPIKSLLFFSEKIQQDAIFYPIVVYEGQKDGVYKLDLQGNEEKSKDFIFNVHYAFKKVLPGVAGEFPRIENFFVDFIHKDNLESFLQTIEKEAEKIQRYLLGLRYHKENSSDNFNDHWEK